MKRQPDKKIYLYGRLSHEDELQGDSNSIINQRKILTKYAEESQAVNVDRFLSVVRRYTEIEELTPAIVHEFIDRIIVHEPEQERGDRRQKVEIIYNNIGAVDRLALKGLS